MDSLCFQKDILMQLSVRMYVHLIIKDLSNLLNTWIMN